MPETRWVLSIQLLFRLDTWPPFYFIKNIKCLIIILFGLYLFKKTYFWYLKSICIVPWISLLFSEALMESKCLATFSNFPINWLSLQMYLWSLKKSNDSNIYTQSKRAFSIGLFAFLTKFFGVDDFAVCFANIGLLNL